MNTFSFERTLASAPSADEYKASLFGLRNIDSAYLVDQYSAYTRERFSRPDGLPVIIPAHNEERDLPATLLALARSNTDIRPVVMDNGSSDSTASVANTMGAVTICETEPSKVIATQRGLEYAKALGYKRVLFTDADTMPGKRWAAAMYGLGEDISPASGGMLSGPVFFEHGPDPVSDAARTLNSYLRDISRKLSADKLPITRGANYLLVLDSDDAIYDSLQKLPANLFPGEDIAIRDTVLESGGQLRSTIRPETFVYSHNDRFHSLGAAILTRFHIRPRVVSYAQDMTPGFEMYMTPNGDCR